MTTTSELRGSRDLFVNLTLREVRGKYKRSILGWGWSLLNPLAHDGHLHAGVLGAPGGRSALGGTWPFDPAGSS